MGASMGWASRVIQGLAAERGVFRSKDLDGTGVSRGWFDFATFLWVKRRGRGIWSHPDYEPTRYELVQLRHPRAVFWGASALWLLGALEPEPVHLWVAIPNNVRVPRTLPPESVVLRTRRLEDDVELVRKRGTVLTLRVHQHHRALADLARAATRPK